MLTGSEAESAHRCVPVALALSPQAAHRHVPPGALALLAAAMLAVVMGNGGVARTVRLEKLDAEGGSMGAHKTHVAHAAALARTHGNKYQQELASLASSAGHNRRSALAKLEALRKRSEATISQKYYYIFSKYTPTFENFCRRAWRRRRTSTRARSRRHYAQWSG